MTAIPNNLSQVKGECIQCDEEIETHELCIHCLSKLTKENNRINVFKLQKLINYKNQLLKDSEMYYAFASANFDEEEETKELALSNKLSQIGKDLEVMLDELQCS